jgi:alkanesulfonate monooxygenase SsuD/methylene tetrahydromethanopterin reductase-like flavin-dependent oxidoreductase (luciferase family)
MWIGGSSEAAIRRTARYGTGWQAGLDSLDDIAEVIRKIREATATAGRTIDEDHYGAGLAFQFGTADEPDVVETIARSTRFLGRDITSYVAIGDARMIVARIEALVAAGVSKFILRPLLRGEEAVLGQTRRLIDQVLPAVAIRWPRR